MHSGHAISLSVLARLNAAGVIDWSRAAADGSHVRALKGGPRPGPARPTGPGPGPKHHVITDAGGISLAATLTGGNRHDVTQLIPLIEAIPPVRGCRGRCRCSPTAPTTTTSTAPYGVTFVAELPKTATGKIQKFVLRQGAPNLARQ
jgi:hypothetical protein